MKRDEVVIRSLGYLVFGGLGYLTLAVLVFLSGFLLLRLNQSVELPWLHDVQRYLYTRTWNVWQSQEGCSQFHDALIYEPVLGTCEFSNLEFQTTVSFDKYGRTMEKLPNKANAIAVVGDSFAMGWGVEDRETFSAVLQTELNRQVYNLSVSSYGTYRELLRLELSGIHKQVDTVIIQYCDNDLYENLKQNEVGQRNNSSKFRQITNAPQESNGSAIKLVGDGFLFSLRFPISSLRRTLFWEGGPRNFNNHYEPLINVLKQFEYLQEKNVVVVYNNSLGKPFRNYPVGKDSILPNLHFIEILVPPAHHFSIDGHMNREGHRTMGLRLAESIDSLGF